VSKRKRTIFAIILVELLLAGGWYYLHTQLASSPNATAESAKVIGQTMGGAMGLILGLAPLLYLMARRNDLKAEQAARNSDASR
jgi:hypothetical protein